MKPYLMILFILFIIFVILFMLFMLFYNKYIFESFNTLKIDAVYTWVDSYDPERELYLKKLKNKDSNESAIRYVQHEELKYSIKSLIKNCPWIRNIYIVVKDGQNPSFLQSNNKIKIINHSDIMPISSLPTFNSMSIEACIHKIKGLSNHYIYMNDDFFINKPLKPSDIFKKDFPHYPYIQKLMSYNKDTDSEDKQDEEDDYNFDNLFMNTTNLVNKITSQNLIKDIYSHIPSFCYKPWEEEIETLLKNIKYKGTDIWNYTVHSKFRKNDNIALNSCFRVIYYKYKGAIEKSFTETYLYLKKENCKYALTSTINTQFFCVNHIDNECSNDFKDFIQTIF